MKLILFIIALFTLIGFTRTLSYAVRNVKNKNISGGAALIILAICEAVISILSFLS